MWDEFSPRGRPVRPSTWCLAVVFAVAGCGQPGEPSGGAQADGGSSGLMLPPGFKVVDLPLETRKQVFNEAHDIRSLAVQEANHRLPMDEDSLPKNDVPAFDKRVADHKAILIGIEQKNLAALAEKHKISVADVERIEEEASRLRWIPPQEPVFVPSSESESGGGEPESAAEGSATKS